MAAVERIAQVTNTTGFFLLFPLRCHSQEALRMHLADRIINHISYDIVGGKL